MRTIHLEANVSPWEADIATDKSHKSLLHMLNESTSRFEILCKLAAKSAQVIIQVLKNLPKKVVKPILTDRERNFI